MAISLNQNKGQFSIEYLVAFLLFSSVLIYLSFQVSGVLPKLSGQSRRDILLSKAYRVTGGLIKNPGSPTDWNYTGKAERYGLAVEPYELSLDKINEFGNSCNGSYRDVKRKLGLNRSDFSVAMYNMSSSAQNEIMSCGQRIPEGVSTENIDRYSVLENGDTVRMVFNIW